MNRRLVIRPVLSALFNKWLIKVYQAIPIVFILFFSAIVLMGWPLVGSNKPLIAQSDATTERISVATDGSQGNGSSYLGSTTTTIASQGRISADGRYVTFTSEATNLVGSDTNVAADVFVYDRSTHETTRVSVASDGTQGNGSFSSISLDGHYVAFWSSASNLVSDDSNGVGDTFVHDRTTHETTRVSVASDGSQGNSWSYYPSISADGHYVVFESGASNLIPNDTNATYDIFVHDRMTGQTTRVSIATDGSQGNARSERPSMSSDGRYITFDSSASNLVNNDTNGRADVFVHDRSTHETTRVSVASNGSQGVDGSYGSSISADGRYVAFISIASNLVSDDSNGEADIFVHDRSTHETTRVSVASNGTQANKFSNDPSISGDGHFVVFVSWASNLVDNDTNFASDVFVHNRTTHETTRVSVASDGSQGNGFSRDAPAISTEGRYVLFASPANNLVPSDTNGWDVFVHDRGSEPCYTLTTTAIPSDAGSITNTPAPNCQGGKYTQGSVVSLSTIANSGYSFSGWSGSANGNANPLSVTMNGDKNIIANFNPIPPPTPKPDLSVDHIQVAQVLLADSDPATGQSIPLIAQKLTLVRVYVKISGAIAVPNVTARLYVQDTQGQHIVNQTYNGLPITAKANPDPHDFNDTVNFLPEVAWLTGDVTFWAEVDPANQVAESNENNNSGGNIPLSFQPVRDLRIALVPIRVNGNGPTEAGFRTGFRWAQQVYPVAHIIPVPLPSLSYPGESIDDAGLVGLLEGLLRGISTDSPNNPNNLPRYIYGLLPDAAYDGGLANFVGGNVAFGDDDPDYGTRIFAQEFAHLLARPHTKAGPGLPGGWFCANPTPNDPSDWPYSDAGIQTWGFDLNRQHELGQQASLYPPNATYDYMSYCWYNLNVFNRSAWTSPHTYNHIYSHLQGSVFAPQSLSGTQAYFIAGGLIYSDTTAVLNPIWVINSTIPSNNPPIGSDYCLEAQNASGHTLVSYCFSKPIKSHETEHTENIDNFNLMLPYPTGIARIVLKKANQELAMRTVSANAPVVTVLSPNGGESWAANDQQTITWTANDADGNSLTYSVLYSPDGNNWVPVSTDITDTQVTVNAAELAGGTNARIRVLATDGINTSLDESNAPFTVGSKGPQAYILSPESDGTLPPGASLFLQGYAYDLEDGTMGESAFQWTSNRDGNLGTGSATLTQLSQGQHIVTLTATDSNGNSSLATINIFVGYTLYLPTVAR